MVEQSQVASGVRPATQVSGRLRSLDGLRGVAAMIVFFHHSLLTIPFLASAYYSPPENQDNPFAWGLSYTPAHLFWGGGEAVYVFFLLSGLVLTLPALRGRLSWRQYYPSRLVRLYFPILAAVVLGYVLVELVPRADDDRFGPWLNGRPDDITAKTAIRDATLVSGPSRIISPLWSLQWEVIFSLLLPVYIMVAACTRRFWLAKMLGALAATAVGSFIDSEPLIYLPMFAIGLLMAVRLDELTALSARVSNTLWVLLVVVALVCLTSRWTLSASFEPAVAKRISVPVALIGAGLAVFVAAFWSPAVRLLQTKAILWLGMVSFSLYLIHEPIVISVAFVLGTGLGGWTLPISLPVVLIASWLFYKGIEQPSHRLAKRVAAVMKVAVVTRPRGSTAST